MSFCYPNISARILPQVFFFNQIFYNYLLIFRPQDPQIMRTNQAQSIFYESPFFYFETQKLPEDWLQKFKTWCHNTFTNSVEIEIAVLDQETIRLTVIPASTHEVICERFDLIDENGSRYLKPGSHDPSNWIDKSRSKHVLIPIVQYRQGEKTKYPWEVLDNIGGLFVVQGRTPNQLTPLVAAYKYKKRHIGNYLIATKSVSIGTVVATLFIEYQDKHIPYERGGSYLRFEYFEQLKEGKDEAQ